MKTKEKRMSTILFIVGSIVLTIVGFIIIPPLIEKCANKAYKASLKKDGINFDNMEPEIVKKESEEESQDGYR